MVTVRYPVAVPPLDGTPGREQRFHQDGKFVPNLPVEWSLACKAVTVKAVTKRTRRGVSRPANFAASFTVPAPMKKEEAALS